jgi:hypothetical protein
MGLVNDLTQITDIMSFLFGLSVGCFVTLLFVISLHFGDDE